MVNRDVFIECIKDSEVLIGMTVDLTFSTEHSIVMFDALLSGKVESICFFDTTNKVRMLICLGNTSIDLDPNIVITLNKYNIEIIRDMLLDVAIGNGFAGYHFDMELQHDTFMDICFLMK